MAAYGLCRSSPEPPGTLLPDPSVEISATGRITPARDAAHGGAAGKRKNISAPKNDRARYVRTNRRKSSTSVNQKKNASAGGTMKWIELKTMITWSKKRRWPVQSQ